MPTSIDGKVVQPFPSSLIEALWVSGSDITDHYREQRYLNELLRQLEPILQ